MERNRREYRGEFFSLQNDQLPIDQPPRSRNSTNDSNTRGGKQAARVGRMGRICGGTSRDRDYPRAITRDNGGVGEITMDTGEGK